MIFPYKIQALLNLVPNSSFSWGGEEWETLTWLDERPCPTKEEWETEKVRLIAYQPLQDCKSKAKQLISNTDWSVLPDVNITNKSEFESYRSILRNYIINPIENPEFPIEPQPIWSVE
jgi:hypothetical protein